MVSSDSIIRPPAMAGRFYPASAAALDREVRGYLAAGQSASAVRACAVMAPHAGYVYSGAVAGKVFGAIEVPERVIILCPNHTGLGQRFAVMDRGVFRIPGADIAIDAELAGALIAEMPGARADGAAHRMEHAIEVELPFLQARQPGLRIVPVVLSGLREREAMELGSAMARAVARVGADPERDVLVVASSDMSHFLPDSEARRVDRMALEPLLDLDPGGLYRTVVGHEISMCGFVPATAMLSYARELAAGRPELVGYATSGEAFGDISRVVGYAGVVIGV